MLYKPGLPIHSELNSKKPEYLFCYGVCKVIFNKIKHELIQVGEVCISWFNTNQYRT